MLRAAILLLFTVHAYLPSAHAAALTTPLAELRVTSGYGFRIHPILKRRIFHEGLDFSGKAGASVNAIGPGRVIYAGRYGGFGNLVVVLHGKDITTHYAHLGSIEVSVAQMIKRGTKLGSLGATGRVTGPHLHFELRKQGEPVNPAIAFEGVSGVKKVGEK